MYVTTFYSFKGGTGRTMALVNVAVELANRGKRVLLVDFDLEAPALDTFDLGRPAESTSGMVDFVREYLDAGMAPDAADFLFESTDSRDNGGGLWIMPAGSQDRGYAARLASIDWSDLYENHDGYLLFEDLKLQWQAAIEPDHVLIDCRTGYTDIGGICTRHLPNAVVLFFFPNQQNLRGLTKIVRDIRAEGTGSRQQHIDLHFVLSNVPDLDGEHPALQQMLSNFQADLGFDAEPLIIHRYNSLSLLNQTIFTKDRQGSRLAQEYRALASEILPPDSLHRSDRQFDRMKRGTQRPRKAPKATVPKSITSSPREQAGLPEIREIDWITLEALRSLSIPATNQQIAEAVAARLNLTAEQLAVPSGNGQTTEVHYRLAWARTRLKDAGALVRMGRGQWQLTSEGADMDRAALDSRL